MKTECNLQHFTRNCRIKNLDDFERDEADTYLWRAGILNVKERRMIFEKTKSKCCGLLMKHRHRDKGEQVITLRMDQQLKTKNINVVPRQLFCRQCKVKFLLETDSLY